MNFTKEFKFIYLFVNEKNTNLTSAKHCIQYMLMLTCCMSKTIVAIQMVIHQLLAQEDSMQVLWYLKLQGSLKEPLRTSLTMAAATSMSCTINKYGKIRIKQIQ